MDAPPTDSREGDETDESTNDWEGLARGLVATEADRLYGRSHKVLRGIRSRAGGDEPLGTEDLSHLLIELEEFRDQLAAVEDAPTVVDEPDPAPSTVALPESGRTAAVTPEDGLAVDVGGTGAAWSTTVATATARELAAALRSLAAGDTDRRDLVLEAGGELVAERDGAAIAPIRVAARPDGNPAAALFLSERDARAVAEAIDEALAGAPDATETADVAPADD